MIRRLLPVLLAVSALAACAPGDKAAVATATKPDTAALSAELASILPPYRAAILAGDARALNALYTDSAVVELTGIPTEVGRAAIMTTDSAQFAKGKPAEWNSTVRSTVPLAPGSVAQTGSWSDMTVVKGGMKMRRAGRWIAGFLKGTDGNWRINYLMAMTDSTTTSK
jgi:ketosteroid isomerase-like protein